MLKDIASGKILKTKSEVSALQVSFLRNGNEFTEYSFLGLHRLVKYLPWFERWGDSGQPRTSAQSAWPSPAGSPLQISPLRLLQRRRQRLLQLQRRYLCPRRLLEDHLP